MRYKPFQGKWYLNFVRKDYSLQNRAYLKGRRSGKPTRPTLFRYRIADIFLATDLQSQGVLPLLPYECINLNHPIYKQLGQQSDAIWDTLNPMQYTVEEVQFLHKNAKDFR